MAPICENRIDWRHVAGLVLLCCLLYGWTLPYGFVWDDVPFIQEGKAIQSVRNIPAMFTTNLWAGTDQAESPYYRPLPMVLLAVDHLFWGKNPLGYHLTNVLLHAAVTVMVYLLVLQMMCGAGPALCAALLFAVHPAHAETVTWVGARTEMLPALFMFAALYAHLRYLGEGRKRWLAAGLIGFWAALLSKEMAVTLPALVVLAGCVRGDSLRRSAGLGMLYGLLLLPYFLVRALILGSQALPPQPFLTRLYTSAGLYADYFRELAFPFRAKVCYAVAMKNSLLDPAVIVPALVLAAVVAGTVLLWQRERLAAAGGAWVLLTLLPVSGLPAIIQPFAMANRYLYIPSFGLALIGAALYRRLAAAAPPQAARLLPVAGLALVALLGWRAWTMQHYWSSNLVFYAKCAEDAPNYAVAHGNLGGILITQNRLSEAEPHLEAAYRLNPRNLNVLNNLAYVLMEKGELSRAGELVDRAVGINGNSYITRFNRATLFSLQGKAGEAAQEFHLAARLSPLRPEPYLRLGGIALQRGDHDAALRHFTAALERNPANRAGAFAGIGAAYRAKGMLSEAESAYLQAVASRPDDQSLKSSLTEVRKMKQ